MFIKYLYLIIVFVVKVLKYVFKKKFSFRTKPIIKRIKIRCGRKSNGNEREYINTISNTSRKKMYNISDSVSNDATDNSHNDMQVVYILFLCIPYGTSNSDTRLGVFETNGVYVYQ